MLILGAADDAYKSYGFTVEVMLENCAAADCAVEEVTRSIKKRPRRSRFNFGSHSV